MSGDDLLRCACGTTEFAMRAQDVRHVARVDQLRPDEASDGRVGCVKVGGQVVPVFVLGHVLGLEGYDASPYPDQHIAVTGDPGTLVGWLVDRIARDLVTADAGVAPLPSSVGGQARRWFEGVITLLDGRPILLLRPDGLNPQRPMHMPVPVDEPVFAGNPRRAQNSPAEPVAIVFSTSAFPPCESRRFALSGREVAAIIQPGESVSIPGAAPHIMGLTMWRNAAVPLLDFRREPGAAAARQLIARSGSSSLVGFLIDAEVVMHRPSKDDRASSQPCPPFARGVFEVDGDAIALLDLDALVAG